jgi:DNA-binding HxlR family transcriptional regulator
MASSYPVGLIKGPARLSEVTRLIPNATKKMLIDSIQTLQGPRWIVRKDFRTALPHVQYSISPGRHKAIHDILKTIAMRESAWVHKV